MRKFLAGLLLAAGFLLGALPPPAAAGDEDGLVLELSDVVAGRAPRTNWYRAGVALEHVLDGQGSQNIPMLRLAVRLWKGEPEAERQLLEIAARDRVRFMGSEGWSYIYGDWIAVSWASVARFAELHGRDELLAASKAWLTYWIAGNELKSIRPGGPVLVAGDRSGGHDPMPGWVEYLQARAMGYSIAQAERWLRAGGKAPAKLGHWEWELGEKLESTLRAAAAPLLAGERPELVMRRIGFTGQGGYWIQRTSSGLAVWRDDEDGADPGGDQHNPNTTAIMASAWYAAGDRIETLPPRGGSRVRQKFEHVECNRVGDRLVYRSDIYGAHELALPPRDLVLLVRIPREGETWRDPVYGTPPAIVSLGPGIVSPLPGVVSPVVDQGASFALELLSLGARPAAAAPLAARLRAGETGPAIAGAVRSLSVANKNKDARNSLAERIRAGGDS